MVLQIVQSPEGEHRHDGQNVGVPQCEVKGCDGRSYCFFNINFVKRTLHIK